MTVLECSGKEEINSKLSVLEGEGRGGGEGETKFYFFTITTELAIST